MKTVKAKIKGTNAILEGCVCDDSFFVSVDHDTFERYDLDEVELCESNPNSLTLEEAAYKYSFDSRPSIYGQVDVIDAFKAGAEWQKEQMLKDAVEGEICGRVYDHINVRFADGVCKYLEPKNISHIPADVSKYNIGDKVSIVVLKAEEE